MKWNIFYVLTLLGSAASYYVSQGNIFMENGDPVRLRGISWFGFETPDKVVNGLWMNPMNKYLDLVKQEGFNVMRIPFSAEWILYNFDASPDAHFVSADPVNQNKKSIEIFDTLMDEWMKHTPAVY